jgi:alkylresorcinol/alkylpyrone synthase
VSRLDVLGFRPLDAERHLVRVSNAAFRESVDSCLADKLPEPSVRLYHRLLSADRSRYLTDFDVADRLVEDHAARYRRYQERTRTLLLACVDDLLARSPVDPARIRAVVCNTTVGGTVPNLTSLVCSHLGLPPSTRVVDLGYMGCAAALVGLELVETMLRPGELGLVVSAELTSVMANMATDCEASLVANTVFGDGMGAFLVAKRPHRERAFLRVVGATGSVLADEDALAAITYEANPVYHEIRLSPTIPEVAGRGVRAALEPLVRRHLTTPAQRARYLLDRRTPDWQRHVDFAVMHTAGSKVLTLLANALGLPAQKVAHNLEAFRQHGNTSSASLHYALDQLVRTQRLARGQRLLFLGYGSGFLTRAAVMRVVDPAAGEPS